MVELHEQLRRDTIDVARLSLCHVQLMNDKRFPWLILIPDRTGVIELHALCGEDQAMLMKEITLCAHALERLHNPDKINIGALGNLVPQLHIHVIARFRTDAAWPGPVWGFQTTEPYSTTELSNTAATLKDSLLYS